MCWRPLYANKHKQRNQDMSALQTTGGKDFATNLRTKEQLPLPPLLTFTTTLILIVTFYQTP
jgi:hypothetical protein